MSKSNKQASPSDGFTLIEVIISICILVVGLIGIAVAMGNSMNFTTESKGMSIAATLASEKLEDLSRWPATDAHVAAGGALGVAAAVAGYYDKISMSPTGDLTAGANPGAFLEVLSGPGANFTVTTHSADGSITSVVQGAAPVVPTSFERTWLIEANTPVAGVRRVTVLVTSLDPSIRPAVNFQMSMVRP